MTDRFESPRVKGDPLFSGTGRESTYGEGTETQGVLQKLLETLSPLMLLLLGRRLLLLLLLYRLTGPFQLGDELLDRRRRRLVGRRLDTGGGVAASRRSRRRRRRHHLR